MKKNKEIRKATTSDRDYILDVDGDDTDLAHGDETASIKSLICFIGYQGRADTEYRTRKGLRKNKNKKKRRIKRREVRRDKAVSKREKEKEVKLEGRINCVGEKEKKIQRRGMMSDNAVRKREERDKEVT